jgi:dipeptidase E
MKLFLASSLDKTLELLEPRLSKPVSQNKVLFIANAADPFEEKWWVDLDRKKFASLGYEVVETDLRELAPEGLESKLQSVDIIHICGGSVFYLLGILKDKKLAEAIIKAVRSGKVIYTGTSAGSIVVSKSTEIYKHDPDEKKFIDNVSEFSGLGLVDFLIIPHCGQADFVEANKAVTEHLPEFPFPLIFLHDNQVVYVEDGKLEVLSQ